VSAPDPAAIDALLARRLASGADRVLADRRATVLFDLGQTGLWTLTLDRGALAVRRGGTPAPSTVIRTDAHTLASMLEGHETGASSYLDGRIVIRGDLSLGLHLDGAFTTDRPPAHPRAHVVTPLGVRTTYIEAGDPAAPPVVLLHGLGATNASLLPLIIGLAGTNRVIAPDLPGHGTTDAPRWRYTAAEYARWLSAFLRAVGVHRAALIGNSLGGRVALEGALTMPHRVDRIILLCPSPALRRFRQFVPVVRMISPEWSRVPLPLSHHAVKAGIRLMFSSPARLPESWYDAGADEFIRVMRDFGHRRAFFSALRQIYVEEPFGTRGFWTRLSQIETPALFVWGENDVLVPKAFARHVTSALPNSRSIVLPDCGHVPQFELPDRTLALTQEFLTEELAA
jgi:pimeloyl-ACP methyl ester carboxylesterase